MAELPFILMHPKPEEEPTMGLSPMRRQSKDATANVAVDQNLIQLDAYVFNVQLYSKSNSLFIVNRDENNVQDHDDDIIFEDFARLRLKGGETEA